ncbi:MAG: hypothetical protein ACI9HK_003661 [Pirellulaceae bacterium]|jgi:hypothetical protein
MNSGQEPNADPVSSFARTCRNSCANKVTQICSWSNGGELDPPIYFRRSLWLKSFGQMKGR